MFSVGDTIQAGCSVVVYIGHDRMQWLKVSSGERLCLNFGCFHHDDIIGKPYGAKWCTRPKEQRRVFHVHALRPTVSLYTLVLSHRTQIIYAHDAAWIISELRLRPGSVVLESGTGSGAFSHHLLRAILPGGHLYTVEYHQERASQAALELKEHGLTDQDVTCLFDDMTKEGFKLPEGYRTLDSVFLDLPSPWKAIQNIKSLLRPGHMLRICSFSPCIEQIQRMCRALSHAGFGSFSMTEVLFRPYEGRPLSIDGVQSEILCSRTVPTLRGHTSYLLFASIWMTQ